MGNRTGKRTMPEAHAVVVRREIRKYMAEHGIKQPEMARRIGITQPSLSSFLGTGTPSYPTANDFARLAELPQNFWVPLEDRYPPSVLLAVEALLREVPELSLIVAAELTHAIAKAGNVFDPGDLARLARPVLERRFGVKKALVPDDFALHGTGDRDKPSAGKRRAPAVLRGKSSRPPNGGVYAADRARKKAR